MTYPQLLNFAEGTTIPEITDKHRSLIMLANAAGSLGDKTKRNKYAYDLAKLGKKVKIPGKGHIETWYDKATKNYITSKYCPEGFEIGNEYNGHPDGAVISHLDALTEMAN